MSTLYDGHVHTPFCPHGTADPLSLYIERAIDSGMSGMTFTEHAPLPAGFIDPVPEKDSGMERGNLPAYLNELSALKQYYSKAISINIGLEVDYIDGWEKETKDFLDEVGPKLDDSILSVHFLKMDSQYFCIDYSEGMFGEMIRSFGSTEEVYSAYYKTLAKSITCDLGKYKPIRIGHITLAQKFQKLYPTEGSFHKDILTILELIKKHGCELDYNSAGLFKPFCKEPYPPHWVVREAAKQKIPLVYGSDAHSAKGLGKGYEELIQRDVLSIPLSLQRK
ncbi:histidinol-phosphatase HisJ [Fictibacillus terranigra]|uniref:Histidinol-phosphatase n=1 Tax=Fictibacillus terranigra TaxID=3058424 RepID=A0ABT8E3V6_9BACL|nr:histidinol-phosphatase HisJ [Fictibacillus sp. CENA-BCM004]MDN4072590.1 histidinol-phosphatase HisJ [Fictibacillus sp. CENA-BCM004]